MNRNLVDIIVVNWNSRDQLQECLRSIELSTKKEENIGRIVIVDNASVDGSANDLQNFNLPLTIIRNKVNRGFAVACNQGAAGSEADYLLFLNPDVQLFENSLSAPIAFMERPENQHIGIVGIQLVDEEGCVRRTCARFPTSRQFFAKMLGLDRLFPRVFPSHFMVEWDHKNSREVDQVIGAFFLVRRNLFEMLGGFDERFFVYFEEVDFSLRARQLGYSSFYLTEAQAYHKGGGSSEQIKARRLFYSLRSRILYGYKHFSWIAATMLMLGTIIVEPLSRIVLGVAHRSGSEIVETCRAYRMLWGSMPEWMKGARR
ncbi:MAG TPA: glycosyltransferase family 2 protein [Tepidanaerobacter syntrophicus]|uniref:glycosyltransferase family 2 protein n=1 Tax=Tepidanaerobacter syntrophicus TaxID=224999 RepID=UPI001759279D|nr:glycosyltransferase family 2 protein [Tepidanaerobacter syntrophicus]HHV83196.1 glycosyltransferase family 2 protein [Tepidanaerobacter syntrophicus]